MKKVISKASFVIVFCLMLIPIFVFAQSNSDTLAVFEKFFVGLFDKFNIPNSTELYVTIAGIAGWGLTRLVTFALKKIKTTWYWNPIVQKYSVNILWTLAAKFFGKSILYYKPEFKIDETQVSSVSQNAKIAAIKKHFKKHDSLLSIDIK